MRIPAISRVVIALRLICVSIVVLVALACASAQPEPPPETRVILPNLHPMAINELGQNYLVNGLLAFQMECLGESKDYDYWFFAGVSGDAHTQIFTTDTTKGNNSLSQIDFGPEVARTWYDAVGYDFSIVTEEQFNADRPRYVGELMKYIDRGIPVIAKHAAHKKGREMCNFVEDEFWLLVGYEDGGKQLLFVTDNNRRSDKDIIKVPTNLHVNYQFILPGAKKKAPALADVYRQAVLNIPALLTRPHKGDLYYGREAFDAWAKRLLAEDYADWTDEQLDLWRLHSTYVCIIATNGSCRAFLERAEKLCPDLPFLADVNKEYAEMGRLWSQEMNATGGSFNITTATLRSKEARQPIAEFMSRYTACCDRIVEIYRANGYAGGITTPRLVVRRFTPEDWKELQQLAIDMKNTGGDRYDTAWPTDDKGAQAMAQWCVGQQCYAVCLKDSGKLIGFVRFNSIDDKGQLDLGHMFHSRYRGEGYASEAMRPLLAVAFADPRVNGIEARNAVEWPGQLTPLIEMGFRAKGGPVGSVGGLMELSREEWEASKWQAKD